MFNQPRSKSISRVSAGTRVPPHMRKPKKPTLESTIRVVAHGGHVDAQSIDGNSPLAYPFWKYRDADRDHHVEKYRKMFYERLNSNEQESIEELERLIVKWLEKNCLFLSHDKPELPCHASVIIEYLCFELRKRGLVDDQYV